MAEMLADPPAEATAAPGRAPGSPWEVLGAFLRLGLTSFGGPVAHLGYFRDEFVARRRWVDDATYADLVALCQFLPGPASSQVGIALGILRAGLPGGLAAWLGFTLPSALLLVGFAYGVGALQGPLAAGMLHGLKVAAVAVVAQAIWGMAPRLCPDRLRATLAVAAAVATLLWPTGLGQLLIIAAAGGIGWRLLQAAPAPRAPLAPVPIPPAVAGVAWGLLIALLIGLPLLRQVSDNGAVAVFDSFFRAGALVFGGGHVVLPLLQAEVAPPGWVTNEQFVAGYGAAQAVPGPLFTFAAYLGAVMAPGPDRWAWAALALGAIFLPAWLLVVGALPFWDRLRGDAAFAGALRGINAAVVGLLGAALYTPVGTSAIQGPVDLALALVAFGLLVFRQRPPWQVVLLAAGVGLVLAV